MKRHLLAACLSVVALGVAALAPAVASAWAPASQATVHPGVMVFTNGAQCTSNFVFTDGSSVYLGQAAHCSSTGGQTSTDGCDTGSLPIGTPVDVTGASKPGTLVYNSWRTMQGKGEADANTCAYNDLALIKLNPADVSRSIRRCPASAARRASALPGGPGQRCTRTATPSCAECHEAQPQAGRRGPERGRWLEPYRLHGDAGNSGRFGQRLPECLRPGDRNSGTLQSAPAAGSMESAIWPRRSPTCTRTARSLASSWRGELSRSTPSPSSAILGA